MDTYIIESTADFNKYYPLLESTSRLKIKPDIYLIGLDTESICKQNYPVIFAKSTKWVLDNTKSDVIICKLQLAAKNVCLLIDLCQLGPNLPNNLIKILKSESWIKSGVGISLDLQYLSYNYQLGQCNGGFELKTIACLADIKTPNLACVYSVLTGDYTVKSKSHGVRDWSEPLKSEADIIYAAKDAYMSYKSAELLLDYILTMFETKILKCDDFKINIINKTTDAASAIQSDNYIGLLQEHCQKRNQPLPEYKDLPKTNDEFVVQCQFDQYKSIGTAKSKKAAKQIAAKNMLELL